MPGPWLTSCDGTNLITTAAESWAEQMSYLTGTGGIGGVADIHQAVRTHTVTSIEYVGVDQATAEAYVADNPAISTYTDPTGGHPGYWTIVKSCRSVRDGAGGAYKVVKETEVIEDWQ